MSPQSHSAYGLTGEQQSALATLVMTVCVSTHGIHPKQAASALANIQVLSALSPMIQAACQPDNLVSGRRGGSTLPSLQSPPVEVGRLAI